MFAHVRHGLLRLNGVGEVIPFAAAETATLLQLFLAVAVFSQFNITSMH